MSCKQPGRMQGVELHAAGSQEVSLSYPYRTNIPILTIFLFFSTLSPQEGVMLMGLVASGGVSAGTTVLSHVIISHCASSRASRAQGAATIHNTGTGVEGGDASIPYTQS